MSEPVRNITKLKGLRHVYDALRYMASNQA